MPVSITGIMIAGAERVTVNVAAEYLHISPRRVRNYIDPECVCILRQRKYRIKSPKPDPEHKECGGTGRLPPKLKAIKFEGDGPSHAWWITVSDLVEFQRGNTGRL